MQPFTLDQAVIVGLLFVLGILIGMFFLAGGKWKRRYRSEVVERNGLMRENERLSAELHEHRSAHLVADRDPMRTMQHVETTVVERPSGARARPGETRIGGN